MDTDSACIQALSECQGHPEYAVKKIHAAWIEGDLEGKEYEGVMMIAMDRTR
jgi:hypothetical protein